MIQTSRNQSSILLLLFKYFLLHILLLLSSSSSSSCAFLSPHLQSFTRNANYRQKDIITKSSNVILNESSTTTLEIVLFGIGDLRTTDHGGLSKALHECCTSSSSSTKILPLCILDTQNTLSNLPMSKTHLIDNANILYANLNSLQKNLKSKLDLDLHVVCSSNNNGVLDCLLDVIESIVQEENDVVDVDGGGYTFDKVKIHSCNLGDIDNDNLGYGPYGHLKRDLNNVYQSHRMVDINGNQIEMELQPWDCSLRNEAWDDLTSNIDDFPSIYIEYEKKYNLQEKRNNYDGKNSVSDIYTLSSSSCLNENIKVVIPSMKKIPSADEVKDLLCKAHNIPLHNNNELELGVNTGLFATHWGGLDISSTIDEESILRSINIFLGKDVSCNGLEGDEALTSVLQWWSLNDDKGCKLKRNPKSLEHAFMSWLMTGGETNGVVAEDVKTKSLIEGELLTRYLAAPIFFGTVSTRYLWKQADELSKEKQSPLDILAPNLPSVRKVRQVTQVMKTIAESQEWHKLFGAKNSRMHKKQSLSSEPIIYDYMRWHGFLCRYATASIDESQHDNEANEGIVLVHGFGASGSQWEKAIKELRKCISAGRNVQALAPDLLGFGQSEKPALSYSQYLWEGYTADCVKEIGLGKLDWSSFTIGGNSIGGYTAMGTAADDNSASDSTFSVSSLGSSGTSKCKGLVLMNSAGKILSKEEINESENTVAESTVLDLLGTNR